MQSQDILNFWFQDISPKQWWQVDTDFDAQLRQRFAALLEKAAAAELCTWRQSAEGRLAEIILLDQMSRNIYRNTAKAFAQDGMALGAGSGGRGCPR